MCSCCRVTTEPAFQLQSCTRPLSVVCLPQLTSSEFCPSPPKVSFSASSQAEPRGLLEGQNVYVAEELLRIADSMGRLTFFGQFQAGFTLAVQDPPYSACSCNMSQDCANIKPLMTSVLPAHKCPHYSVSQECAAAYALCQYADDCSSLDALGSLCSDFGASLVPQGVTKSLSCNESTLPSCYSVEGLSANVLQVLYHKYPSQFPASNILF